MRLFISTKIQFDGKKLNLINWTRFRKKILLRILFKKEGTQAFTFGTDGVKCTQEQEVISLLRSSVSKSVRFQWKIRFQEKEAALSMIVEMERFLTVATLKSLGNCKHKG